MGDCTPDTGSRQGHHGSMQRADKAARAARFLSHIESLWTLVGYVLGGVSLPTTVGITAVAVGGDLVFVGIMMFIGISGTVVGAACLMRANYLRRNREAEIHVNLLRQIAGLRHEFRQHMVDAHGQPPDNPFDFLGTPER